MFYILGVPLAARRYRLHLTAEQAIYADRVAGICRAVWNAALEQRRIAAELNRMRTHERQSWPTFPGQCADLTMAKRAETWLAEAPANPLQQTLRDLDRACLCHGLWRVRFRSKRRSPPSFRFSDPRRIGEPVRLSRRWGSIKLPRLGVVRFRWTRPVGGTIHNVTVRRTGDRWFICFCVDDGRGPAVPNALPPVGIDRGVAIAVATSDGDCWLFKGTRLSEHRRLRRLQQCLARQNKSSRRRQLTVRAIGRLFERGRNRRTDFAHQTAHRLTTTHGLVVMERLQVQSMTRTARGILVQPGRNVAQKAGLNRAILDKAWGKLQPALNWHGKKNGCAIVGVTAAYTSQTCSACGHIAPESRETQAKFRCVICGYHDNADLNAARNILAAGLAVTGRGDLGIARSAKRQPPTRNEPVLRSDRESSRSCGGRKSSVV
jgi:putative transposase